MRFIAQNLPSDQAIIPIQLEDVSMDRRARPSERDGAYAKIQPVKDLITTVIARPQSKRFKPCGIMIENAKDWLICGIRVGPLSMMVGSDRMPAEVACGVIFAMNTVEIAQDFAIDVTYIGSADVPQTFVCDIIGDAFD